MATMIMIGMTIITTIATRTTITTTHIQDITIGITIGGHGEDGGKPLK